MSCAGEMRRSWLRGAVDCGRSAGKLLWLPLCLWPLLIAGCGVSLNQAGSSGVQVSPGSLDLGNVTVGQSSAKVVTVSNQSSSAVSVSQVSISGGGFTLAELPEFPLSLAAGKSLAVEVIFSPSAAGTVAGAVSVSGSASTAWGAKAVIKGNGIAASAASSSIHLAGLNCSSLSLTGSVSDACTVSVTSAVGSDGFSVALSSSSPELTVPPAVMIQSGASSATFTAQATGVSATQKASLSAIAGSVTKEFGVTLYSGAPLLTVSATSLDFGSVNTGSSATLPLTVSNNGNSALTISSASASGTGFSVSGASFPVSLDPGSSITLQVQFAPSSAGSFSGALSLSTDPAGSSTTTIALSGTGQSGTSSSTSQQVQLSWSAPTASSDPVVGYNIYRQTGGSGSYTQLNSSLDTSTGFADSSVSSGKTYSYYVRSVDASGNESSASNVFTVSIP